MQTDHDAEEETEDEGKGRADIEAEEEEERERREEREGEPSDGGSDIDDLTDLLERREWGEEPPEGQQGVRRRAGRGAGSQPAVRVALSVEGAREGKEEGEGGGERDGDRANGEEEEPDVTIEEWEEKWKFWDSIDLEAEAPDDFDIPTNKHISATFHPALLAILEEYTQRIQSNDLAVVERGWKVLFYFLSLFLRVDRRGGNVSFAASRCRILAFWRGDFEVLVSSLRSDIV
uniref:Uncharacterized protein n=1 Tax=Chromera velia CCMP2878 TaxID=1169474 RepID=A0A0G4I4Z1_9ALVE|eukprot:Cvel_11044.t1-p1 / transcript=Cvel_11044.t1 / gene=Cvel_11044 / organism=Chromera_velia_CCMP2878 / gene_product=hypothetical protein / transcript_product=hypothetical protein / location=Cvel_scaffold681:19593-20288(-) / protein_length=232 / sequence_SO=supercontig / SO=protein_coding / is_pseudo=false